MHELLPILRSEFPEFDALQVFEAGIPAYAVRLALEVLEPQKLTSFQSYMLHAIALGVNTRGTIAHLLGVDDRDLVSPGASLLKLGCIQQDLPNAEGVRPILLTDRGRQALEDGGAPPAPKLKVCKLHFNALTWTPIPLEDTTWSVEQMYKEGLFILPTKERERPTLGDFSEKEVAAALSGAAAFKDNVVIALLELKKVDLQYIAPVTVVLLHHRETGEERLAVYRNGVQQRLDSEALQRAFDQGTFTLPADATSLSERGLDVPIALPPHVAQASQDLVQNEYAMQNLQAEITEYEVRRTTSQNDRERRALEERVQQLKEELRQKRTENEGLREQLRQNQVEFLRTEQHRPWLMRALREAQEEVVIISPWMNRRACDDELCALIGSAIVRGVRIRIGYGFGKARSAAEADRNHSNVSQVKSALRHHIPPSHEKLLEMKETSGTHQKILVCDKTFAISSSFNWLSYAGQQDEGYRNETGTVFRHLDQVDELARIALQTWSS